MVLRQITLRNTGGSGATATSHFSLTKECKGYRNMVARNHIPKQLVFASSLHHLFKSSLLSSLIRLFFCSFVLNGRINNLRLTVVKCFLHFIFVFISTSFAMSIRIKPFKLWSRSQHPLAVPSTNVGSRWSCAQRSLRRWRLIRKLTILGGTTTAFSKQKWDGVYAQSSLFFSRSVTKLTRATCLASVAEGRKFCWNNRKNRFPRFGRKIFRNCTSMFQKLSK